MDSADRAERTKWFMDARFGMFIHWGLYSLPARGEWVRSHERISNEEYEKYFNEFDPTCYNPVEWAKLAKKAGMKYAVLTAKHHDGFCLFDSKLTDYKSTNTKSGRDLVREFLDAFRSEGLKVGLYYSLLDWHHEHYPAYGDNFHPMRQNEAYKDKCYDFSQYITYFHGQVKELLVDYGKLDIMWFDFSYDNMTGEKWKATELINMIRSIQPHIIIDNRLAASGSENSALRKSKPAVYAGDFECPEQIIPPEGIKDENGSSVPWEACITLNNNWGYNSWDKDFKSTKQIIRALVECVSKNGNLLVNVGPDAKGLIPNQCIEILSGAGEWMSHNSSSIYGCCGSGLQKPEWGRYTSNGKKLYAHILDRGIGPVNFRGLGGNIVKARLLSDGAEIKLQKPWNAIDCTNDAFISFPSSSLPDDNDTVVELELKQGNL